MMEEVNLNDYEVKRGFSGGAGGKEPSCQCRRHETGLIPGSGRSSGEENGTHFSILAWENPMNTGAW